MKTLNSWTPETLTDMSLTRAGGYLPGVGNPRFNQPQCQNRWTAERLIHWGEALAQGYGAGL